MAVHDWASNVIAGVENPRILIVGPELIDNQSFEENLTDWTADGGASMSRASNTTTPFGDYIMDLEDASGSQQGYAKTTVSYGTELIQGKKFIASCFSKYGASANQIFSMRYAFFDTNPSDHTAMEYWKKFIHEITVPTGSWTAITLEIYPTDYSEGASETGHILVDNVSLREILYDIQLPLPYIKDFRHGFIPLLQSGYKLANGVNKKFYKGLIYYYSAFWRKLTSTQEQNRNKIIMENQINGNDLIIFPHKDSDRCYLVSCENDRLEWSWMAGVALGHEGGIELIGNELFQMAPDDIVTESYFDNIFISEDIIIS